MNELCYVMISLSFHLLLKDFFPYIEMNKPNNHYLEDVNYDQLNMGQSRF